MQEPNLNLDSDAVNPRTPSPNLLPSHPLSSRPSPFLIQGATHSHQAFPFDFNIIGSDNVWASRSTAEEHLNNDFNDHFVKTIGKPQSPAHSGSSTPRGDEESKLASLFSSLSTSDLQKNKSSRSPFSFAEHSDHSPLSKLSLLSTLENLKGSSAPPSPYGSAQMPLRRHASDQYSQPLVSTLQNPNFSNVKEQMRPHSKSTSVTPSEREAQLNAFPSFFPPNGGTSIPLVHPLSVPWDSPLSAPSSPLPSTSQKPKPNLRVATNKLAIQRPAVNVQHVPVDVFVGGLPPSFDETKLMQFIHPHVESIEQDIIRVIIIRDQKSGFSKGYGFVTFRGEEQALVAISKLKGLSVRGRMLTVNLAAKQAFVAHNGSSSPRRRQGFVSQEGMLVKPNTQSPTGGGKHHQSHGHGHGSHSHRSHSHGHGHSHHHSHHHH
eukprot:GCRY01002759.1.p1 GENE.GCRY01002759.1~~GCRY01002759.1.p1  ORF type:complete len:434 (+),score=30.22 GCRY01002759.1:204-1505(+)